MRKIKNRFKIILLALSLVLVACGTDMEDGPTNNSQRFNIGQTQRDNRVNDIWIEETDEGDYICFWRVSFEKGGLSCSPLDAQKVEIINSSPND